MCEAVVDRPCEAVVEGLATQTGLNAAAAAPAGVGHHAPEAVAAGHDGQLLVAHLHVEGGQVEQHLAAEEVQVGAHFIVPAGLGGVGDGVLDGFVGLGVVLHGVVAAL